MAAPSSSVPSGFCFAQRSRPHVRSGSSTTCTSAGIGDWTLRHVELDAVFEPDVERPWPAQPAPEIST